MWVEMLPEAAAAMMPRADVSLPKEEEIEIRVVVWRCRECLNMDEITDMNDLVVRLRMEGSKRAKTWAGKASAAAGTALGRLGLTPNRGAGDKDYQYDAGSAAYAAELDAMRREQSTDVHWRARDGKGSFNWRFKFRVPVNSDLGYGGWKQSLLHVDLWDRDVVKQDDKIAGCVLDLHDALLAARHTGEKIDLFLPAAKQGPKCRALLRRIGREKNADKSTTPAASRRTPGVGSEHHSDGFDGTDGNSSADRAGRRRRSGERCCCCFRRKRKRARASAPLLSGRGGDSADEDNPESDSNDSDSERRGCCSSSDPLLEPERESGWLSVKRWLGIGRPENAAWLHMRRRDREEGRFEDAGQVLLSIELMPVAVAEQRPAGLGRSAPNAYPELPKPVGRLEYSLNPYSMGKQILGPALCHNILCTFLCFVSVPITLQILAVIDPIAHDAEMFLNELPDDWRPFFVPVFFIWPVLFILWCCCIIHCPVEAGRWAYRFIRCCFCNRCCIPAYPQKVAREKMRARRRRRAKRRAEKQRERARREREERPLLDGDGDENIVAAFQDGPQEYLPPV
jgi:hypothetical protein